jgi:apolipoprotein N-acyltransferase
MTARTDVEVNTAPRGAVSLLWALLLVVVGAAAFNGAFAVGGWGPLIVVFLFCAVRLTHAASAMGALLLGLLLGVAAYAPQAYLLTGSFGIPALTIIGILALCVAIFAWVGHQAWRRLGPVGSLVVLPFLWTGLEYCRAELCPPRFSWLTTGLAMPPEALHRFVGSYGVGFVLMGVAAAACSWRGWNRVLGLVVALGVAWGLSIWQPEAVADTAVAESNAPAASGTAPAATMADAARATGATTLAAAASAPATAAANTVAEDKRFPNPLLVTLPGEHPNSRSVAGLLNAAAAAHPEARFFFLTEYAMALNDNIARWCGTQKKYVIAATQVPVKGKTNTFRLTAAVTKSDGNTGLIIDRETPLSSGEEEPSEPELLETGWGKMGVVIFHDLGHRKEMDAQVRAGARALVVVAPDVEIWGLTTQDEHSRIPAVRAVEYGIPIVRATSNGLSQIIAPNGQVVASSGADHVLAGHIPMTAAAPHVPIDALGGPICMILAALYLLMELGMAAVNHTKDDHPAGAPPAAGPGNVPPAAPSA